MKRKIYSKLLDWKNKPERLPLLLYGARQTGKTYILTEFGRQHYDNIAYVNFEQSTPARMIFDGDLSPTRIIELLNSVLEINIQPNKTLLIFDEIQACDRALTALKYFAEQASGYHIVAAGSLLGVAVNRENFSFPVGKVQIETLYSMDFEEYLWARGKQSLVKEIRSCFIARTAIDEALHIHLLEILKEYLLIGGMPAVVKEYLIAKSYQKAADIQSWILSSYVVDMTKYATASESAKIRAAFATLPMQLAKDNQKFQYKLIKKGASATHFGVAIDWLESSGVVIKCRKVNSGYTPLSMYTDMSGFKLFPADVGLFCSMAGILLADVAGVNDSIGKTRGILAECYMAQCLAVSTKQLYYWESDGIAEVDFVIVNNGLAIPVEVKSSTNTRSRSLEVYRKRYNPGYVIRISEKNFGFENRIFSVPLYAAFLI
ncbi:MAG: AAA family ATPase [Bacillota bacterium]